MPQFDGIIPELARAGYFNKINGIEAGIEDVYAQIGSPNGIAPLGENGLIEPQYLPSYVDDVLEYPDYASLPVVGEQGKIYITVDETKVWRWSGTVYIEIVASPSSTDSVPEGLNNLYYTAERAQSDVVNITGNADTANRLSTARIIQLSGGVTGSGLFNGGSNLTIAATVVDDSHNHSTSTIEGLSDVATSGDYSDLLNKPILGSSASKDVPTTGNATDNQVVLGNDSRLSDDRKASDVWEWAKQPNKPTYTATEVGAQVQSDDLDSISGLIGTSGVLRKIGENQYELAQDVVVDSDLTPLSNAIAGKVDSSLLGVVNGVATLDSNGDIPLSQLPAHNHTIANVTNLQTALDGKLGVSDTAVAATTLTGLTSTITELNYVDGVTSNVQTQLNSKVNSSQLGVSNGVATLDANGDIPLTQLPTHSHAISDVVNLQTTLNGKLGVSDTAIAATTLTGLTSTITELNYVDGVTSNVQTQLNGKQPLSAELTGIAGISATSGLIKKTGAGTYALDSTVYTSVGSVTPLVDSGSTGVVGVSTSAARSDHVHPVATSVLSNSASTTSVSVGISTNGVAGTSTSISAATTSQAGVMSNSQVVSLNTAISDISTLQTTVAGKEPSFSVLPVSKGGTGASSLSGVLKGNGTSQLLAATSTDILALVPDATASQSGKMTTSQVSSLNELAGLVSMGSGVVKKTLNTSSIDTYSMATIADLITSTNVVTNLNVDMLDGLHVNNARVTTSAHIPFVGPDSVMEIGKYIDFHAVLGNDYELRLEAMPVTTSQSADLRVSGGRTASAKVWHSDNHGANSGLDADMLDGNHASAFALSGHTHGIATTSTAGFLSTADAAKLNALTVSRLLQVTAVSEPPVDEVHDLNNFTTNGFFHHKYNSYASTGRNYPASYAGMLDVKVSDSMVYQWYHTYNNKGVYFRSKYISTWYPWCKVFDSVNTTSTDILALVPDATTLQSGKMTTTQVNSLNELGGLVSMGSGIVKKTLSTTGLDTYSTASISDLVTSTNAVTNLNADMLDGNHASAFALSDHVHSVATTLEDGFMSSSDKNRIDLLNLSSTSVLSKNSGIGASYSGHSNLSRYGSNISLTISDGVTPTQNRTHRGALFSCSSDLKNSSAFIQNIYGVSGFASNSAGSNTPGSTATKVFGGYFESYVNSTDDAYKNTYYAGGFYSLLTVDFTKSEVGNAFGGLIKVTGTTATGATGTVDNVFGLYIDTSGISNLASNVYSIYSDDSLATGYLAGNLNIGSIYPNSVNGGLTLGAQYVYLYRPNDVTGEYYGVDTDGVIAGLSTNNTYVLHTPYGLKFGNAYSTTRESEDSQTLDWYEEASVTLTSSGLTTNTTATAKLTRNGNLVSIDVPTLTGAGTATTFKLTGLPTRFRPLTTKEFLVRGNVNGVVTLCRANLNPSGQLQVYAGLNAETFSTTSSTRGINQISLTYQIS